ncbi:MAG TPA: prephenate dehydrogenase/arogenate dehydrogenase family protein [Candidatus Paceibacterota bacterium]
MVNTVGIIGYGNFGQFLQEVGNRFFPTKTIKVFSRRHEPDGENFFTLAEASVCDVVILCGAIREYESQLKEVLQYALPETIIVDVATVKKHTSELLRQHCEGRRFVSTHPMFGPESYKKHGGNVSGFRIVVTDYALQNDQYQRVKNSFAALGFTIIEMTADEHDKHLAETLFLTHYVGQSILKAEFGRTNIDTLSFQFLMDAVESVKDDKELFHDVYRFNPYCKGVAERFHEAQEAVFKEL